MKKLMCIAVVATLAMLASCTENYSNGERVGFVTKFSNRGILWKSWEGELNSTQTGMNTSSLFSFSIDNDNPSPEVIALIDSAATLGWKVKLIYHETFGKNWFDNRGDTDHFIKQVVVLDRDPMTHLGKSDADASRQSGRVVDTVYVVIYKNAPGD